MNTPRPLSPKHRTTLLDLARESIRAGLQTGKPLPIAVATYDRPLQEIRASFVTLNRQGSLRGCIGHLEATEPLVGDVVGNAFGAAFRDPRFAPVSEREFPDLEIHISILTAPERLNFTSEQELIALIRPGIDGLILEDGSARGTFLPAVWESLGDPREFLAHLKRKAGLPKDHWSKQLRVSRYQTESFS